MDGDLLALFPLHTVLFPGMPLPLHIFEERYKLMIGRCLEEQRPFGIVLIRTGPEVGGPAVPHSVGTAAHIAGSKRLEDGRINLVAVGQERFTILEIVRQEPYLIGRVAPLVDQNAEPGLALLSQEVRASLLAYLSDLFTLLEQPQEQIQLPVEPGRLSLVGAAVMQIPLVERQTLLQMTSISARLSQLREWLAREREKQQTLLRVKKQIGDATPLDPNQLLSRISLN